MPVSKPPHLRRELIAVLAVKLALIVAIKLAFFSEPPKPGEAGTARALLLTDSLSIPPADHPTEPSHE